MSNRYVVDIDAYIYADSEEEAIHKARAMCEALQKLDDNKAAIIHLAEMPFGVMKPTKDILG